jgi:mRNA interferase MazF
VSVGGGLRRGDVVLVLFPFTDLSGTKRRPALIVGRVESDDLVLAFITSRGLAIASRSSYALSQSDVEFQRTGLKMASSIRLDKLATLHRRLVTRRLGSIGPQTDLAVAACLRHVLEL